MLSLSDKSPEPGETCSISNSFFSCSLIQFLSEPKWMIFATITGVVLKEWHSMEDSYSIFNFSQIYSGSVFSSFIWEIISPTHLLSGLLMLAIKNRSHTERKIVALSLVLFIWSCYTQLITWKLAAACMPFSLGSCAAAHLMYLIRCSLCNGKGIRLGLIGLDDIYAPIV